MASADLGWRAVALLASVVFSAQAAGEHSAAAPCSTRYAERWAIEAPRSGAVVGDWLRALGVERLWGVENLRAADSGDAAGTELVVRFPAGSINPNNARAPMGGAGFLYAGPAASRQPRESACLSYELRFPAGFDFVRGGKLPGLYGGEAPSGGEDVTATSGFSLRYMWRSGGEGEIYAYLPGKAAGAYGESVGRGRIRFVPAQWHRLEQELVLNAPGTASGIIRVWEDGALVVERSDVVFRASRAIGIEGLMFSSFFGGHDPSWASPRDQTLELRRIRFLAGEP